MTSNQDFKVTPLFDAEYLRNGTRYIVRPIYNETLIYTVSKKVVHQTHGDNFVNY